MRGLWAGLLLFLVVPAAAAPATLTGTAHLPLTIQGEHAASGDGIFVLQGDGGAATLLASGAGTATRIVHRAYGVVSTNDPDAEVLWNQRVEKIPLPLDASLLSLVGRGEDFTLVVYDASMTLTDGPSAADQVVGAVTAPLAIEQRLAKPLSLRLLADAEPFSHVVPAGELAVRAEAGRLVLDGPYSLWIQHADLRLSGATSEDVAATVRTESRPGGIYNPLTQRWQGPGTHDEFLQEALLVQGNGHLEVQFDAVPATMYAHPSHFDVMGTIQIPAMDGTITVNDDGTQVHELTADDVLVGGRIQMRAHDPDASGSTVHLEGSGDVTQVTYGAVAATYDWTAIAKVGVGAALVAGAVWLATQAKTVLGAAAGSGIVAGYARVQGPAILEHPVRAQIYERIKANPGITLAQLATDAGLGSSTLTHHLRHLERNEFVTMLRDGRYMRLFDRQSGSFAGEKKKAAAALSNPVTAAMARHIEANPGIGQSELATHFGVTASTVSWHMTRLQTVGLVQKQRDAARTRYYVGASVHPMGPALATPAA